ESQLLEDVVCLVFLENYFNEFAHLHEEDKLIRIIRKIWEKMSEKGHLEAFELQFPPNPLIPRFTNSLYTHD
ncbi:MAG: DUF4202 family protein, partial [Cyclobacteriaceae bacterium]|nr:DUF4202 family protein [Cyclobacteriaceae bacterium]